MKIRQRSGQRPDRRIEEPDATSAEQRAALLAQISYEGSGNHKLGPGDYNFVPSHNPRPTKSVCDDLRPILKAEAQSLFVDGITRGMTSPFPPGGIPKYVWAVDKYGEPYEAKTKPGQEAAYHGYRLGDDEREMRRTVLKEWKRRCPKG